MGKYSVIGGDMRCRYMAEYLGKMGNTVKCLYVQGINSSMENIEIIDNIQDADGVLVLPVPVSKDGENIFNNINDEVQNHNIRIEDIIKILPNAEAVCGGVIPASITKACKQQHITCYDYMKDDDVACKNAVATAEGAILEAFALSNINIDGSNSLVTGYGRCAKALAARLKAWNSNVTIMARTREACEEAEAVGYGSILLNSKEMNFYGGWKHFDFCFNTIPAFVLDHHILSRFSKQIVVIDIASKPGGTDFDYCEQEGIRFKHSLGIPGRYSPETSGIILAEAIQGKY
jgi:dipicolinate synthase subunit A